MRNYRSQLQEKAKAEVRELEARHHEEVMSLVENHVTQVEAMRHAYDVQISEEATRLEEQLQDVRVNADLRVGAEKRNADKELTKLQRAHQQRIEEYKKNSDEQLQKLRKELQASTKALHEQARKSGKKDT